MRILIIDDNNNERKLLKMYLQHAKHQVLEAKDGIQGLALAREELPEVIIFDISMPGMDGFQFLQEIKGEARTNNIPLIAYSSVFTEEEEQNLISILGADGYILKGKDFQEFLSILNENLVKISAKPAKTKPSAPMKQEEFAREHSYLLIKKIEEDKRNIFKMQKLLSQAEEKYRYLFNSIRDVILLTSLDREIIDVNGPALQEIFGYQPEEVIGKSVRLLYPDEEKFEKGGQEFFAIKEMVAPKYLNLRLKRKNGEVFIGEVHAFKLLGDEGIPLGNVTIIRDVSQRILNEQRLKESEELFRVLAETINTGLFIYQNDRFVYVNPMIEKTSGYSLVELNRMSFRDLIHPDYRETVAEWEKMLQKGLLPPPNQELKIITKSGEDLWIILSCGFVVHKGEIAIIGSVHDITSRKRYEEALRESETRLRLIIKSANVGLWSWNIKTNETYLSPEWKKQLGYEDEEIPNDNNEWVKRLHPADKERILSIQNEYLKTQAFPYIVEFRLQHKDGSYRWILSQGSIIKDEKGEPQRLMGSHIDITERKKDEETIRESYLKIRKALEDIVNAMAKIVETRDPYTAGHQRRVADLATAMAQEMGWEENRVYGLQLISLVHDVGKIYVPAEILNKPGKLNHYEFNMVKTHVELGYEILKNIEFPWPVASVVEQHHERLDGSGYPQGLKGEEIMLEARILAVADVVEAMCSPRPYRPAHPLSAALTEIENGKGITYDAEVVEACLRLFREKGYQLISSR